MIQITTTKQVLESKVKLTPMMSQYFSIKKDYLDTIVLFRMGDFYEAFFEDAVSCSKILNIALTYRGKIGDLHIPMSGMPHHAASTYIDRITSRGLKVVIVEQVEDPKDAIGIVKRAVTQIASPGIPFDIEKAQKDHQWICSSFFKNGLYYLVSIDFTTGEFIGEISKSFEEFIEKLRKLSPKEFITYMGQWDDDSLIHKQLDYFNTLKTHLSSEYFNIKFTSPYIEKLIPSFKQDSILKKDRDVLCSIGALSYYIFSTQYCQRTPHIRPFLLKHYHNEMRVTLPTLEGLEILPQKKLSYRDTLIGFIDKTQTAMGKRKLKDIIINPLNSKKNILIRQKLVEFLFNNHEINENIIEKISQIRDIERILTKVSTGKANGADLLNISLIIESHASIFNSHSQIPQEIFLKLTEEQTKKLKILSKKVIKTINGEIGASLEKGNLIKLGASKKRDQLYKLQTKTGDELKKLEERYRKLTKIPNLKIKSNNISGYFIEISKSHLSKAHKSFERRQTLVNTERYISQELLQFEEDVILAKDKLYKLEKEIFENIIQDIIDTIDEIVIICKNTALIDVFTSFAKVSLYEEFSKPIIKDKKSLKITGAWHPLIKSNLKDEFIPHNINLNEDQFFGLITGPNMAGKTTVMREVAIIQLLTQIGCFIPAQKAELSLCDHLFSRLGANDNILNGQSTFMVEMAETAEILRHSTNQSLIIIDEVGRGTSTYDGLSIAWALVEHLIDETQSLTLFATHYHELISLIDKKKFAKNFTVEVLNQNGNIQFLYNLIEKSASQSFGLHVAKLAGVPPKIIQRSKNILNQLEKNQKNTTINENTYFEAPEYLFNLENKIDEINIIKSTPIEVINKLDKIKKELDKDRL